MKDAHSVSRTVTPVRLAAAAAAAAALTASIALVGHYGGSSLANARLSSGVALMAGGSSGPDGTPVPCLGPEYCNVG